MANEITKTPKMKITEPKTPFNKDTYDIIDDEGNIIMWCCLKVDGNTRARSPEEKEHSELHWGEFEAAIHKAAQEQQNVHYSSDSDHENHAKQLEYSYSSGTDSESGLLSIFCSFQRSIFGTQKEICKFTESSLQ